MEECLRDLKPFILSHLDCYNQGQFLDDIAPLCDANQTEFERDYCDYKDKLSDTCDAQDACTLTHGKIRNDTHVDVRANEVARKSDYETGKKVLCYFGVFESNNSHKNSTLAQCNGLVVNTSLLDIIYPTYTQPHPCNPLSDGPCASTWTNREYDTQTWFPKVTMKDCEACPTPAPSTAPTPPAPTPAPTPLSENFESGSSGWTSAEDSAHYTGTECYGGSGSCWRFQTCHSAGDLFAVAPLPSECKVSGCTLTYKYKGNVIVGLDGDGVKQGAHDWHVYPITSSTTWTSRTITNITGTSSVVNRRTMDPWTAHLMFESISPHCTSYLDDIVIQKAAA